MAVKRIGIFMHRFDGGGAERMTILLANELHRRGYEVSFIVRYNYGESKFLLDKDIPVIDLKVSETSKIKKNVKNVLCLRKVLAGNDFDILLSITAEMSQVAALATWLNPGRMPVVQVLHNTLSMETHSFQRIRELLLPMTDNCMDGSIAVSKAVRLDYLRLCGAEPRRVFTVYNPVVSAKVLDQAREAVDHPWLSDKREWKTLVMAGRLSYQKNHALMFRAMQLLNETEDYRLILLGIGELEDELKRLAAELGITDKVDFCGYNNNPYKFFSKADGLVLSSHFEGLPTVLIEALACRCRIISTDCPSGPREILGDGAYGTLVPVDDAEALVRGIRSAMATEPDGQALMNRAMDFTIDKSADRYIAVLDQIQSAAIQKRRRAKR